MRPVSVFLVGLIVYIDAKDTLGGSLNVYDTYNADECQRIRRPWHKLTPEARDLYISGLLQLRKNGNGNVTEDELVSIASVHDDPLASIHRTSHYLFWHGYLVWELESRIRNLGGKWRCFGMPYWDFTLEAGREAHPLIFDENIGGNGDPDNYWTVNGYSWFPTIEQYWVPYNCKAKNDKYPLCSLKRILATELKMPDAKQIGDLIINNPDFVDFAEYAHISGTAGHLTDAHAPSMDKIPDFPQGFEPIWYLFHSAIEFHHALWVDCNNYDLININDLQDHPEAFTPFCYSENRYGLQYTIDEVMPFGGSLPNKTWSYIYKNELTVRKLYMLPQWNIIYDLVDGQGFYTDSGLNRYCKGKLNNHWFLIDRLNKQENDDQKLVAIHSANYLHLLQNNWLMLFSVISIGFLLFYSFGMNNRKSSYLNLPSSRNVNYGSV